MAAPKNPKGAKSDKWWRDALMVAVKRPLGGLDEQPRNRLTAIAEATVLKAVEGDMQAIKEIGDRLDGKPAQAVVGGDGEGPVQIVVRTGINRGE